MRRQFVLIFLMTIGSLFAATAPDIYHTDHRASLVKVDFVDFSHLASKQFTTQDALSYIQEHHQKYGLPADLLNLEYAYTKHSLLGSHHHFQQMISGVPVHMASIIVSVNHKGQVYMVFNGTFPEGERDKQTFQPEFSPDEAMEIGWQDLKVHGDLILQPSSRMVYYPDGETFKLTYLVEIATHAPFGYWEQRIDAISGEVLDTRQTIISRKPFESQEDDYRGPVWDRTKTTDAYLRHQVSQKAVIGNKATGSGDVFDPDPATTLQSTTLQDTTPASTFTTAYVNRTLQDITESSGQFSLTGPWVSIVDFEAPSTAPSTTSDGMWTAKRGDNAFNDAMTYFHVDQNQRYIQSLGFTGATGIQFVSISADSDGVGGADNSFFSSNGNRISFGHGCVDDNEDAFVILHEYGHAIQFSINNQWVGGDTGGMGEGFGDYWAGSYKFSTPNGASFRPEWAFPWDGHNNCWDGRLMNVTSAQYNSNLTYGAHQFVGGALSDELWSTPLFQSLITLTQMGVARSEVDRLILQAHFGLGSAVRISEMAQAIVNSAQMLYPNGPHATVFNQKFAGHNIQTTVDNPPPAAARTLVYAWVSNNSQYESIVVVNNYGSTTANLTLTAQRSTGPSASASRSISANGYLQEKASSLFPGLGDGIGYTVKVESDVTHVRGGWVTNNLEAASGRSPSQGVAVTVPASGTGEGVGTKLLFSYLPITNGLTSAPVLVNLGSSNTNVTMRYYNQQGTLIATDSSTLSNMAPFRPFAAVANNLVPQGSPDVYMIAESSGEPITGVGFVFNNFSEPAIGNVVSITD